MTVPLWAWAAFGAVVVIMLAIDLLAHRGAHIIKFKEAAIWSAVWVGISLIFAGVIFFTLGADPAIDFTTAWLLEKSLSVDNLFVFALIFGYFQVPREYQHRVLFYGVIGALVFRGIFLAPGVAIVSQFTAVLFVFGAILIYSAIKLLKDDDETIDPGKSFAVRLLRKLVPVSDEYRGTKFFYKEAGKRIATPLLAVVVAIEAADLIFAVDSVPAVLAVSDNTFIIYASNAFAILGLRALYFLLAGHAEEVPLPGQGSGLHPRLHRRQALPAGRPQGHLDLHPGDPVAGLAGRDRAGTDHLDRGLAAQSVARGRRRQARSSSMRTATSSPQMPTGTPSAREESLLEPTSALSAPTAEDGIARRDEFEDGDKHSLDDDGARVHSS